MSDLQEIQQFHCERRPEYPASQEITRDLEDLVAFLSSLVENRGRLAVYITGPDDDKKTRDATVFVLGYRLAHRGHRITVVDADFTQPGLSGRVEPANRLGFLDLLFYGTSPASAVVRTDDVQLLPAGSFPVTKKVPFTADDFARINRMLLARTDVIFYGGPEKGEESHVTPLAEQLDVVLHVSCADRERLDRELEPFTELGVKEILSLRYAEQPARSPFPERSERGRHSRAGWIPRIAIGGIGLSLIGFLLWWGGTTLNLSREPAGGVSTDVAAAGRDRAGEGAVAVPPQDRSEDPRSGESIASGSEEGRGDRPDAAVGEGADGPLETPGVSEGEAGEETGSDRSRPAAGETRATGSPAASEPGSRSGSDSGAETGFRSQETSEGEPTEYPDAVLRGIPGSGGWAVWVSSFKKTAQAEIEVKNLGRRGYQARYFPVQIQDKGLWYRVFVGNYPSRDVAVAARTFLLQDPRIDFAQVRRQAFVED